MTEPDPDRPAPTETDRLIAAAREEGRKTRTLLIWLLVGIPLIAGAIWGLVALAAMHSASNPLDASDTTSSFVDTPTTSTSTYPPPDQSAIEQFTITDATTCTTIDDWYDTNDGHGPIDPADAPIYDGSILRTDQRDALVIYLATKGVPEIDTTTDQDSIEATCAADAGGDSPQTVLTALQDVGVNPW